MASYLHISFLNAQLLLAFLPFSLILSLTTPFSPLRYAWDFSTFERRIFMGFWIFMCVTVLLIPFLMISFGGLFFQKCSKGNQFSFWLPHFHVYEKCRYLAVCPSLFWENLAYPWLDSDHTFCHSNAFCNWKRQ